MNETIGLILLTAGTTGGIGLACGAIIALAAKYLSVYEDPKVQKVLDILPMCNCAACGTPGCAEYAKAVVEDGYDINKCAPGGAQTLKDISALMGLTADAMERPVAIVLCGGDQTHSYRRHDYNGVVDCWAADEVGGGDTACEYGCLGYGSCSRVCPTGAIEITQAELAVVIPELCISCGECVPSCPRDLIKMIPESRSMHVLCNSPDKGPLVKKVCDVGCIGCKICVKHADDESISMDGYLAIVDYDKPLTNMACVDECPTNTIVFDPHVPAPEELVSAPAELIEASNESS